MLSFPTDQDLAGTKVLVMGLGLFGGGEAVVRFLCDLGARVTVTDLRSEEVLAPTLDRLRGLPFDERLGRHDVADFAAADWVVVSPAVPLSSEYLRHALRHGARLTSEVGLTLARLRGRLCMVTGSKGKSTTTALIHHMAQAAGMDAYLGGNIGQSLLPIVDRIDERSVVAFEVSSFQLEQLMGLARRPVVVVITNLFPVHLDRHGDFATYCRVKETILLGAGAAVLPWDDEEVRRIGARFGGTLRWHGGGVGGPRRWRVDEDRVLDAEGRQRISAGDLQIIGRHNLVNATAACLAVAELGADLDAAISGAGSFPGLPHRLERARLPEPGRIQVVDDSIATTPTSVAAALCAVTGGVVLLLGGKDSGASLAPLLPHLGGLRGLVAFGDAGPRVAAEVRDRIGEERLRLAADLAGAVEAGVALVREGESLLLSPGFPSFDEFRNFRERGERFQALAIQALHQTDR